MLGGVASGLEGEGAEREVARNGRRADPSPGGRAPVFSARVWWTRGKERGREHSACGACVPAHPCGRRRPSAATRRVVSVLPGARQLRLLTGPSG